MNSAAGGALRSTHVIETAVESSGAGKPGEPCYLREVTRLNNYLKPDVFADMQSISILAMAHVGDAVFELMVRTWLCMGGVATSKRLHNETIVFVSAKAQAEAAVKVLPELSEEERAVFKRGRNAHVNTVPHSSTYDEYHTATGVEALFGYLYLKGESDRLSVLFEIIVDGK